MLLLCSLARSGSAAQVIFLKDGSRLELLGVEDHQKLKAYVERQMN